MAACKEKKDTPQGPAQRPSGAPSVFSAIVTRSFPMQRNIEAPGTILPLETTNIQPEISGRVTAINFKEGTNVGAGALLVKLFDADLQAQLKKLEVQLQIAEATEKRQKELLAINGTSQQDYDNASLNVSNIKADIELLKVQISRTEIRAPFAGKLGFRNISLGAYVTPATVFTNISQVNSLKAEFAVPEKYAAEMLPGKMVSLKLADGGKVYNATIIAAENVIAADTRNLMLRALINNPDRSLSPGAFVQVSVNTGGQGTTILVPSEAVIPSTRFKKLIVMREGKAIMQNVQTGYRDSARIEITTGIVPGDTVITTGLLTIKEGAPLQVQVKDY